MCGVRFEEDRNSRGFVIFPPTEHTIVLFSGVIRGYERPSASEKDLAGIVSVWGSRCAPGSA